MPVSDKQNQKYHACLPIDDDEVILAVYKHHWFAYFSVWVVAFFLTCIIMGLTTLFVSLGGSNETLSQSKPAILAGGIILSLLVFVFSSIPVWLRSQEHLVLTEEALLQTLQPSLFAAKTSQLNLEHINDISVRRDFFGTILGYGFITIETPGEQNNYDFTFLPNADQAAKQIQAAHENFQSAVQSGRMPTTLGVAPQSQVPALDPQQYQQFLQYQQMQARQQAEQSAGDEPSQDDRNNPTSQG